MLVLAKTFDYQYNSNSELERALGLFLFKVEIFIIVKIAFLIQVLKTTVGKNTRIRKGK